MPHLFLPPGIMPRLRGFATNVANYNPTGSSSCPAAALAPGETVAHFCHWVQPGHPCCTDDSCNRVSEYNSGPSEIVFAQARATSHTKPSSAASGPTPTTYEIRAIL